MKDASFVDLLETIVDNRGRTAPTATSGIPLIATNCIKEDHLFPVKQKVRFVDEATYNTWFRGHPEPGDILFVCKGSPGRTALVPDPVDFVIAQDMVAVRADPSMINPRFLFAALRSPGVRQQIDRMHVGSLIPHFKKGDFDKLRIPLPDRQTQEAIGDFYIELSEKIESNRRLTELIPTLIRAHVNSAVADGSVVVPVSDLATFTNGGAYTKGATGAGRMVIRIAELNSGPGSSTVFSHVQVPKDKTARAGDLLMAWSGSLGVYRWYRDEAIINQHIFKVVPTEYPAWLVFDRLEAVMPVFRGLAADKATTMGHIQRGHLSSTEISVPSSVEIARLDETLAPLWERLLLAERENLRLSKLRDALLPELLSGRLRTPVAA